MREIERKRHRQTERDYLREIICVGRQGEERDRARVRARARNTMTE